MPSALPTRALASLSLASLLALTSCGGASYSYQNVSVVISPQVSTVQVGATQNFSTTTANAPNVPVWTLNGVIVTSSSPTAIGTFTTATTDAPTGTYTAPSTPPIYTQAQLSQGYRQGVVTIGALVHSSATNFFPDVSGTDTFTIVGPITAGLLPATATIRLGTSTQFSPYVVGTLSNAYTLSVNGFPNGGTDVGTITATGFYTAPATMPMSGPTITITVTSTADTTKTGTATITLQ